MTLGGTVGRWPGPSAHELCSVVGVSADLGQGPRRGDASASSIASDARRVAEGFVSPLGRRWVHVQAVAKQAADKGCAVDTSERGILVAAAWLHDIGYSPEIDRTRFHPLDGARYLRVEGWPAIIVNLVAHHSGARFEAEQRGLADELADFPFPDGPLLDALALADLTTGPAGERLTYDERIAEILRRYPEDDPVHKAWLTAAPVLRESVQRAEARLAAGSA